MIGVFGGTFDPVHNGHLAIAQAVLDQTACTEIRFIPCKSPILKPLAVASCAQRVAMLQLALAKRPEFIVDTREIVRNSPSYMLETLMSLKQDFPQQTLGLILGADAFLELPRWYRWQELTDYAQLLVINRPGSPLTDLPVSTPIHWINLPPMSISSTDIRKICTKTNLPEAVWAYIQDKKLYL